MSPLLPLVDGMTADKWNSSVGGGFWADPPESRASATGSGMICYAIGSTRSATRSAPAGCRSEREARQEPVDAVEIEHLRIEAMPGPIAIALVLWMTRIAECLEELGVPVGAAAVLRRAGPLTAEAPGQGTFDAICG